MASSSSPQADCGLLSLPDEIIEHIVSYFALAPDEIGSFAGLVVLEKKRSLQSLLLVCRRVSAIATARQYHSVGLRSGYSSWDTLVLFLRTVAENPDMGRKVKHFRCDIILNEQLEQQESVKEAWDYFSPHFALQDHLSVRVFHACGLVANMRCDEGLQVILTSSFFRSAYEDSRSRTVATSSEQINGTSTRAVALAERIFGAILCLLPRVRSLCLSSPSVTSRGDFYPVLDSILSTALVDKDVDNRPLQHALTLELTNGRRFDLRGFRMGSGLSGAPNLEELKIQGSLVNWNELPVTLRKLDISCADITPAALQRVAACRSLESLALVFSALGNSTRTRDLDRCLSQLGLLQTLLLRNYEATIDPELPWPASRLTCLGFLTQLKTLELETPHLFGSATFVPSISLAKSLPQSLQDLYLTEQWTRRTRLGLPEPDSEAKVAYLDMLSAFAQDISGGAMSSLKNVYILDSAAIDNPQLYLEHRKAFAKGGVNFCVWKYRRWNSVPLDVEHASV